MTRRLGWWTTLGLLLAAGPAVAQTQPAARGLPAAVERPQAPRNQAMPPRYVPAPRRPPAAAVPAAAPRRPTAQRAPAPPTPRAPFRLSPQQEVQLDRVLYAWQQHSQKVKTFEGNFTRWEYDPVFGPPEKPKWKDEGQMKYAAPDKGMFKIKGERAEHWICDGQSVYEYNYAKKQLIERKLPPHLRGKAIADGPLPFLFGAEAAKLKQRYWLRIITPQDCQGEQIWLEAYPRFQRDAANFKRAEFILTIKNMEPYALQIFSPNGKNRTVYLFYDIVTNDPLRFLRGNPFHAFTPLGWKKIVEDAAATRLSQRPAAGRRR